MTADDQICWSCENACAGGCCWFEKNEPVPNWIATETKIKVTSESDKRKYYVSSYKIKRCPLYKCKNPADELSAVVIAEVIGVKPATIGNWRANGKLKLYLEKNKRKLKKLENYYVNKV